MALNLQHLAKGSTCPPLPDDKVRIYAMRFCPFAQRALLTSTAKNVPTDIVFINLEDKPDWLFEKNPGGKVPAIEYPDGKILYESLIIADYIDEAFPGRKLHPQDPYQKARDRILVENLGKLSSTFYKMIYIVETPLEEIPKLGQEYEQIVSEYAKELEKRGTKFFAGNDAPGMIDYMIWPWFERRPVLQMQHPGLNFDKLQEGSKPIDQWISNMKQDNVVQTWYLTPLIHHTYNQTVRDGSTNFNMLV